jgi:hypothetical protein
MRSLLRKLGRLLRLAAFAALVIGAVRAVLGMKKPATTGEASWPPLADDRPADKPLADKPPANEPPAGDPASGSGWVEPVDGICPASHPIKANAQSKIFHVPGGASYERTVPERCYLSAKAAEADGFRAAKR